MEEKKDNTTAAATEASAPAGPVPTQPGNPSGNDSEVPNLAMVLDIPLKVSVELGRCRILVQDLLKLHKGSVIELNKMAGDALEVLVNERVVAKGEVIVVNEKFGLRLTDIISHTQRIRQLGDAA